MKRKTLLIVDDIELNRAILYELFHNKYTILEAENGKEALQLIEAHADELSVVLLDVVMPVMDGIEMLRHFNSQWLNIIPVILITAENNESTALAGYNLGVADIINKPFNPEIVSRRGENVIELYTHKRNLEEKLQEQYELLERQAEKLKQANTSIIDMLSTVVEFRNGESGFHVRRIRYITKLLLEELGARYDEYHFSDEQIQLITDASALHDIGKIVIPDAVLLKPGKLTPEEYEIIKTHTIRGCEILENLEYVHDPEFFTYCYEICRHHHERWDGRGYPDGLKGNQISIWAQVVALADVYEALTNKRIYKPPYSHEQAVSMILNGECGSFNPRLLSCFLEVAGILKNSSPILQEQKQKTPFAVDNLLNVMPAASAGRESLSERTLWLLELEREKYRTLSDLSGEITFDYDVKADILQFSEKYITVFEGNFKIEQAKAHIFATDMIAKEDLALLKQRLDQLTPEQDACKMELRIRTLSGEQEWFELYVHALWKGENAPECVSLIGKLTNIHTARLETERLRLQANTDALTGLYNRKALQEMAQSLAEEYEHFSALFFVDVDEFKAINDAFGHEYGDEVLNQIAQGLRSVVRKTDAVGRIGGDEFVILWSGNCQRRDLEKKAREICTLFRRADRRLKDGKAIGLSVGIACANAGPIDFQTLLAQADKALYYAKKHTKGRYAFYTDELADGQGESLFVLSTN